LAFWLKSRAQWRERAASDDRAGDGDAEASSPMVLLLPDNGDIARIVQCSPKTLRKRCRDDLDCGVAEANAIVSGSSWRTPSPARWRTFSRIAAVTRNGFLV
jgi:hypothetical protein